MDVVSELEALVGINSVFPNENAASLHVEARLRALGFSTRRVPISESRFNVVGERGTEGKPIILYGHIDTVPIYGKWETDPLHLTEKSGKLYGLGAYDMKGGCAAILSACESSTPRRIRVIFGVDEENNSAGAWALAGNGDFSGASFAVVPEINDGQSQSGKANTIMLGRRGRTVYEITIPGKSAHGAHIEDGVSAIDEAAKLVLALKEQSFFAHSGIVPAQSQFVRKISAENTSLSLPEFAVIELDRHIVPPANSESVLRELRATIDSLYAKKIFDSRVDGKIQIRVKRRAVPYLEPYLTDKENQFVRHLSSVVESEVAAPNYTYGLSVADENVIAMQGVPTISFCPHGGNYHSANEWVDKKSLHDLTRVLRKFIETAPLQ